MNIDLQKEPKLWETLSDKVIIEEWPWLRLHEQELRLPHGGTIPKFWVMEYPDWCCVIAITTKGKILLIRQYRQAVGQVAWELPAGLIDAGESPMEAAQRELLEETGYSGGRWQAWAKVNANPSTHTNTTHCYLALDVEKKQEQNLELNEELTVYALSKTEVRRILMDDKVLQALHATPLWKYLAEF